MGPIFYVFANDDNPEYKSNAEADTFFVFTNLMSEIRDNFCKVLDKSDIGITGRIAKVAETLQGKDYELWENLV